MVPARPMGHAHVPSKGVDRVITNSLPFPHRDVLCSRSCLRASSRRRPRDADGLALAFVAASMVTWGEEAGADTEPDGWYVVVDELGAAAVAEHVGLSGGVALSNPACEGDWYGIPDEQGAVYVPELVGTSAEQLIM